MAQRREKEADALGLFSEDQFIGVDSGVVGKTIKEIRYGDSGRKMFLIFEDATYAIVEVEFWGEDVEVVFQADRPSIADLAEAGVITDQQRREYCQLKQKADVLRQSAKRIEDFLRNEKDLRSEYEWETPK